MKDVKNSQPPGTICGATVHPINNIINQNNLVTPIATDSGSGVSHVIDISASPIIGTTPVPTVIEPSLCATYSVNGNITLPDKIDNNSDDDDDDIIVKFAPYSTDSYKRQLEQEKIDRLRAQEKKDRPAEGRLVDGELRFDDDDEDEKSKERDPNLVEGSYLPEYMQHDFPSDYIGKPIEEIDPSIKDKVSN